jgi:hypothetical protein
LHSPSIETTYRWPPTSAIPRGNWVILPVRRPGTSSVTQRRGRRTMRNALFQNHPYRRAVALPRPRPRPSPAACRTAACAQRSLSRVGTLSFAQVSHSLEPARSQTYGCLGWRPADVEAAELRRSPPLAGSSPWTAPQSRPRTADKTRPTADELTMHDLPLIPPEECARCHEAGHNLATVDPLRWVESAHASAPQTDRS